MVKNFPQPKIPSVHKVQQVHVDWHKYDRIIEQQEYFKELMPILTPALQIVVLTIHNLHYTIYLL